MAHEAQVRYSKLVDLKLRATLVKKVGVICNSRYEGSPKAGSVKVPVRDTEVAVNDYNKQTGAELTGGDTTYLTVNIDKDKAVNEIIDGFDAASVPDDLVADRLDSAGYSLALQVDSDGSAELTTAGTAFGTTTALTEKTIYGNVVDARTKLSTVHVPTEGRWLLVSPEIYGLLLKSLSSSRHLTLAMLSSRPALWAASLDSPSLRILPSARMWSTSLATPTGLPSSTSGPSPSMCRISMVPASISARPQSRAARSTPSRSPSPRPSSSRRKRDRTSQSACGSQLPC